MLRKPSCFGKPVSGQTAAENDCPTCPHLDACTKAVVLARKPTQTAKESAIVEGAIRKLNALPRTWAKKFHGTAFGHAEVDVYGCCQGRAFFLEGKRPGEKPTPRQQKILERWAACGAITGVFTSADEAVSIVQKHSN